MLTKHLETELARMRHENSEIRKELLTSALTHRNLSTNELHKVMEKFASIQNATYLHVQPKNVIITPRGTNQQKSDYDLECIIIDLSIGDYSQLCNHI